MANHTFNARNINDALPRLTSAVLNHGEEVGSRLGERTLELTQVAIRLERPWEREVLVPGRRVNLAAQIVESVWVLSGRNDIEALTPYLPRAADFSDDGETWRGGYGPRLRNWIGFTYPVDQLDHVVDLLKSDRTTRRAVMSIYDPRIDTESGKDIPCNDFITFLSRGGELEMHVTLRSNDLWWGWSGINAFEWSLVQEVVAYLVGIKPGPLHFSTSSLHLYDRHWARARKLVESTAAGWPQPELEDSPRFAPPSRNLRRIDDLLHSWWAIERQLRHDASFEQSSVRDIIRTFPEPLLRSWLYVVAHWWSGDDRWLHPIEGTRLAYATKQAVVRQTTATKVEEPQEALFELNDTADTVDDANDPFVRYVTELHREKNAVYGDSWRRRGEQLAILANIARKVDRLGEAGGGDTAADTYIDLLVYLVKYDLWLQESTPGSRSDDPEAVGRKLARRSVAEAGLPTWDPVAATQYLKDRFEDLTKLSENGAEADVKLRLLRSMQGLAFRLAKREWLKEQHPSSGRVPTDNIATDGASIDAWLERNATRVWNPEAGLDEGFYEPEEADPAPSLPADRNELVEMLAAAGVQVSVMDTINWSQEQQEAAAVWAANPAGAKPEFLP